MCALFGSDPLQGISKITVGEQQVTVNARDVHPYDRKIVLEVFLGHIRPEANTRDGGVEVDDYSSNEDAVRAVLEKALKSSDITESVVSEVVADLTK